MSDRTLIAFLRVDLQDEDAGEPTSLRIHTALGAVYPTTSQWSDYLGTGAALSISDVANETTTAASQFEIGIVLPNVFEQKAAIVNLLERILNTSLENRAVCVHAVELDDLAAAVKPEPYLVLAGKVANVEITAQQITLQVYTAATLLNQVVGGPSRYTDLTHKRFIDSTDQAFRFQTESTSSDPYFP